MVEIGKDVEIGETNGRNEVEVSMKVFSNVDEVIIETESCEVHTFEIPWAFLVNTPSPLLAFPSIFDMFVVMPEVRTSSKMG